MRACPSLNTVTAVPAPTRFCVSATPIHHSLPLMLFCLSLATPALAADVEAELDTASGFVIQNNSKTIERLRVDEATDS